MNIIKLEAEVKELKTKTTNVNKETDAEIIFQQENQMKRKWYTQRQ